MNRTGFDRIAPFYDLLAKIVFGNRIIRSQLIFLPLIPRGSKVLVLGGGTGKFLRTLYSLNPDCELWYIDASGKMISLASEQNGDGMIHFIKGTEGNIPADVRFDAVLTFFFLDLFDTASLAVVINKIKASLNDGAYWIVADFVGNGKLWKKAFLRLMYFFFRIVSGLRNRDLPDWQRCLSANGLKCLQTQNFYSGFIKSVIYSM